jgi:hypothetical protein
MNSAVDETVVLIVNAPYKNAIAATTLAACLSRGSVGAWPAHVATFFMDVDVEVVLAFAADHRIPRDRLGAAYAEMKSRTGESNPEIEGILAFPGGADQAGLLPPK